MYSFTPNYSLFFIAISTAFLFPHINSLPIDNPYKKFIAFLISNNCTMPSAVELPFPSSSDSSSFSYLDSPLKECQTPDAVKENDEAKFLCSEIFDVLQNITCFEYNTPLPKIKNIPLSQNICNDFKSMQDVFPKGDDYLSGKLGDGTLCKLFCTKEKYELLCKTLLWTHDVQVKINSALEQNAKENEKENMDNIDKMATSKTTGKKATSKTTDKKATSKTILGSPSIKVNLAEVKPDSNKQEINNEMADRKINDNTQTKDNSQHVLDLNDIESSSASILSVPTKTTADKTVTLSSNSQIGTNMRTTNIPTNPKTSVTPKSEAEADNQKVGNSYDLQPVESNQNLPAKDIDLKKDEIDDSINPNNVNGGNGIPVSPNTVSSLTSEVSSVKDMKNISLNTLQETKKLITDVTSVTNTDVNGNSDNLVPQDNEMDNELNNINIEEKEKKIKTDDKDNKLEKPKLTDFETPVGSSDIDLKEPESTTLQVLPDKDEDAEHQDDKEQEQYNDTENDGDYPKSEYENSFNPPLKNKETNAKSPVIEGPNQMSSSYDTFISSRNNIGRVPDDIQMIPPFPEQEDSHFFFYFLSIVLILMAGYLIFHNKQKIIALIVEGRHERRRRSHGAGYKKLETK